MKRTTAAATKAGQRHSATKDLAVRKIADVKNGFIIDWAATKPSRPGEERGVIAIIKPAGGA
jgi:hypothetical protein